MDLPGCSASTSKASKLRVKLVNYFCTSNASKLRMYLAAARARGGNGGRRRQASLGVHHRAALSCTRPSRAPALRIRFSSRFSKARRLVRGLVGGLLRGLLRRQRFRVFFF